MSGLSDITALNQRYFKGSLSIFASATTLEAVDYAADDHLFSTEVKALLLDSDALITLDTKNSVGITLPLQKGYNGIAATKIYKVGSVAGVTIIGLNW